MAGCGPWVAVLSLFCLLSTGRLDKVVVVPLEGDVATDTDALCAEYSDGLYLRTIDVYDMIKENFRMVIQDMNDELLMDFMKYADEDEDQRLSLPECVKLLEYIQKID